MLTTLYTIIVLLGIHTLLDSLSLLFEGKHILDN